MSDLVEIAADAMGAPTDDNEWGEYPPFKRFARLAITAIEKAGYRIVPVEPTEAMVAAGDEATPIGDLKVCEGIYAAMLAAAPKES